MRLHSETNMFIKFLSGKFQNSFLKFSALFFVYSFFLVNCTPEKTAKENAPSKADEQIKFYIDKISQSPKNYPSYALLANAYLDKTRETGDPQYLAEARKSVEKSMEIQPNYQAMKTAAMIANYSHRFSDAVIWAEKAAQGSPEGLQLDSEVSAILIEAYLGLGQTEKAEKVLDDLTAVGKKPDDFFIAVSRGHLYTAGNKTDEAVKAFEAAADFAEKQNARDLVVWANVMAAGCLLDSSRTAEAKPYLEKAEQLVPENKLLQIHRAELLLAENRPQEALEKYEDLLKSGDDPEIHRQAFLVAQQLNQNESAEKHFRSAVQGFQKIIASGEIYTLGPLAQVYCDADRNLAAAERLARQNLEYKMDNEARKTYDCIKEKLP